MALLRQEARFVDHLFASGMVDEAEHEQLLKPIGKRERRMQRQGALWRVPLISEVGGQSSGGFTACIQCAARAQCSICSACLRLLLYVKGQPAAAGALCPRPFISKVGEQALGGCVSLFSI